MGAIFWYVVFCCLVITGVVTGIVAGLPTNIVATIGVWTVSLGAIITVVYRYLKGWRSHSGFLR